jgi:hypothetical protein
MFVSGSKMISSGYSRVNVKRAGLKFYAPYIASFGRTRHLKKTHKTAAEAKAYAARFAARLERFLIHAEKEVPGN